MRHNGGSVGRHSDPEVVELDLYRHPNVRSTAREPAEPDDPPADEGGILCW
jgi:hypothetical protein